MGWKNWPYWLKDGTGQNTRECMKMAEHTIYNEGTITDLRNAALIFLQKCNN